MNSSIWNVIITILIPISVCFSSIGIVKSILGLKNEDRNQKYQGLVLSGLGVWSIVLRIMLRCYIEGQCSTEKLIIGSCILILSLVGIIICYTHLRKQEG